MAGPGGRRTARVRADWGRRTRAKEGRRGERTGKGANARVQGGGGAASGGGGARSVGQSEEIGFWLCAARAQK